MKHCFFGASLWSGLMLITAYAGTLEWYRFGAIPYYQPIKQATYFVHAADPGYCTNHHGARCLQQSFCAQEQEFLYSVFSDKWRAVN